MSNKIDYDKVMQVLKSSKYDINIWDIMTEFDSKEDEEVLDVIEEYRDEFDKFLDKSLSHIMERVALRIAFATVGDDKN